MVIDFKNKTIDEIKCELEKINMNENDIQIILEHLIEMEE